MTSVLRYLTGFFSADTLQPGLFQKNDGTVWIRNPDGSESQVTGAGGSGPVQTITVDLTAAQVATLNSVPVEIVPAPGSGKAIAPIAAILEYKAGTEPFGSDQDPTLQIADATLASFNGTSLQETTSRVSVGGLSGGVLDQSDYENEPLQLSTSDDDPEMAGSIATASVSDGGTQYLPGDTGAITATSDSSDATFEVDTVSNSFTISAVSQGGKTFTVVGDASGFGDGDSLSVYGSPANDGNYTIVSAVFSSGHTVITVVEDIPDAASGGAAGDSTQGQVGSVTGFHLTAAGTGYAVGVLGTPPSPHGGQDMDVSVDSIVPLSDGSIRVTVLYSVATLQA